MLKGISPLIATVLLVAFTIAIGTIVSIFFTNFSTRSATETTSKGEATLDCTFASISFGEDDIEYNLTAGQAYVTAQNTGQEELYDIQMVLSVNSVAHVYSPTIATQKTSTSPWLVGQTIFLSANITDGATGTLDSVSVRSAVCPNNAKKTVEL